MSSYFSRQAIGLFCGLLVMSSLIIGLLSVYKYSIVYEDNINVAMNDITMKSSELNSLKITNSYPLSDSEGKKLFVDNYGGTYDYFDFEVTSNYDEDVYYEIYLTQEELANEIDLHYVKFYLMDLDTGEEMVNINGVVPTFYDLHIATSNPMAKRLYYGLLEAGKTKKYRLKMRLSDSYSIDNEVSEFAVKVHTKVN